MTRKIVLLRGVNVGGRHRLPMQTFASILEGLGCRNVRTYIQSGNAVFDGAAGATDIAARIDAHQGFRPQVFMMTVEALRKAIAQCPFRASASADPKSVHLYFLDAAPDAAGVEALGALKGPREDFAVAGKLLYLLSPGGLTASKIADRIDRVLKIATTARNWNTVSALVAMADEG